METTSETVAFETKTSDGLHELVHRAARAAAADELDSGGMLEIRPDSSHSDHPLCVEAAFSDDGLRRTIAQINVHVRVELEAVDARVVEQALARFGGTKFTNVCFATPADPRRSEEDDLDLLRPRTSVEDALDVTIDCSAGVPFYVSNLALTADELTDAELEAAVQCLKQLGVGHSRSRKNAIRVSRHQLRAPMRSGSQAAAFVTLTQRALSASLYSATIPTTQSVRFAWRPSPSAKRSRFELCLSRGLGGGEGTTKEHVGAMGAFILEHFEVGIGEGKWIAESRRWTMGSESKPTNKTAHWSPG